MDWWILIMIFVAVMCLAFVIARFWYLQLANKMQSKFLGLIDRCEMEYLLLVDREPDKKHQRGTYFAGFQACMREIDSLLLKLW